MPEPLPDGSLPINPVRLTGEHRTASGRTSSIRAPLETDVWIYRVGVGALALSTLITVLGSVAIAAFVGKERIPDGLTALGSAALGGIAGMLVPSPIRRTDRE